MKLALTFRQCLRACSLVVLIGVVLASGWAGVAWAVDGGKADPTNDVFDQDTQKPGPGPLDIVKVSHHDDGRRVTYTLRTAKPWSTADLDKVFLNIEKLEGVPQGDCQQVTAFVVQKSAKLDGRLEQCLGAGSSKTLGPVSASHAENTNTITFSFELSLLRNAGFTGDSYRYSVVTEAAGPDNHDIVPNNKGYEPQWITHTFDAPATAAPVAPVAAPSIKPTVVPTSAPTVEPSPVATVADAESFSAPGEGRDDSNGATAPLRAAAVASVIVGGGLAFVRFWPFR